MHTLPSQNHVCYLGVYATCSASLIKRASVHSSESFPPYTYPLVFQSMDTMQLFPKWYCTIAMVLFILRESWEHQITLNIWGFIWKYHIFSTIQIIGFVTIMTDSGAPFVITEATHLLPGILDGSLNEQKSLSKVSHYKESIFCFEH